MFVRNGGVEPPYPHTHHPRCILVHIMMRLIALAAFLSPVLFAQEQVITWQTSYREALKEAAATKKPVFLEFRCEA